MTTTLSTPTTNTTTSDPGAVRAAAAGQPRRDCRRGRRDRGVGRDRCGPRASTCGSATRSATRAARWRCPSGACATSIVMCMVLGTALAVGLNWKARRPAYTYVVVASLLTFVSLGAPLVSAGASAGTQVHADRGAPDRGRGDRAAGGAVPAAVVSWGVVSTSLDRRRPTRVDAAFRRSTYG